MKFDEDDRLIISEEEIAYYGAEIQKLHEFQMKLFEDAFREKYGITDQHDEKTTRDQKPRPSPLSQ